MKNLRFTMDEGDTSIIIMSLYFIPQNASKMLKTEEMKGIKHANSGETYWNKVIMDVTSMFH